MTAGSATGEPGAQDNRFQCNPNDPNFEPLAETEDGKQYRITLLATQNSAGDFVVDSVESAAPAEAGEESEAGAPADDEGESGAMGRARDEYPNPAVEKMLNKESA